MSRGVHTAEKQLQEILIRAPLAEGLQLRECGGFFVPENRLYITSVTCV
jgi:hypothetical protein